MTATGKRNTARPARPAGNYGLDAPYLLAVPALLVVTGVVAGILSGQPWPLLGAALVLLFSGFGFYANRRGKFLVWSELLDGLQLRDDEQLLDLGCGREALLVLAAARLPSGRAIGVDLWRRRDQSGNASDATWANVVVAGVADQIELQTADMTDLPFVDQRFDLVVSNVALHNLSRAGQDRALDEATRVLKPGGRLLVTDLRATARYEARLRATGMNEVTRANLGWRMWWSGPWLATSLVSATKPLPSR